MNSRLEKLKNAAAGNIISHPKVQFSAFPGNPQFPLIISPFSSGLILAEWARKNGQIIDNLIHTHGAILFRGFEVDSIEKFKQFLDVFDTAPLEYRQRTSPRYEVARNIYHSTTYPADQSINMHSENSYAVKWAMRIVFCCLQPAAEQGETPIADNRLVLKYLKQATIDKFLNRGVRYVRNISRDLGLPWQEVFQTSSRAAVEEECKANGMRFSWDDEDRLRLSWDKPAIYNHPVTNEPLWFNHAFFFNRYALDEVACSTFQSDEELPFNTFFGDGSAISEDEIKEIRAAYEQATIVFPWLKGDVLFLDNMLMAHGRKPYRGLREIIVSML
jgi:hypothetical protein